MKKITLAVIILILINFICSSFCVKTYSVSDPEESTSETEEGEDVDEEDSDSSDTSSSDGPTYMTMEDYKALDEGKATINGSETKISLGDSDVGSATSKFGTVLATLSSIFVKIISNVTGNSGFYRTEGKFSASNTGLFTINSLVFGEYMLFNAKPYEKSTDLNPDIAPNDVLEKLDELKGKTVSLSSAMQKIGFAVAVPLFLISILFTVAARKARDLVALKKILVRWVLCIALLFFFRYIFIIIDTVSDICIDTLWNMRMDLEDANYQSFEYTVECDILDSMEKTGGVTSLAYSFEFFVIVLVQLLFLIKYIIRVFVIQVLFILAPIIIVYHSLMLMLDKNSDALGELFKSYIILVFMQSFHALFFMVFFFSMSEIAIKIPVLGIFLMYALLRAGSIAKAMFGWEIGSSILSMNRED